MPIKEDLIYFLKNGKFENINFGISRSKLIELLGEPDFYLPEKSKFPMFLEYDVVEFYFEDESEDARLQTIQVKHPDSYSKDGSLIFEHYGWNVNLKLEEAISFLDEHQIETEEKPDPLNPDYFRRFITESGVSIYFTNQTDENVWELYSFGRTVEFKNPIKPMTKQISFQIEKEYYETLREKAEETKESIASQCKKIIESYLKEKE